MLISLSLSPLEELDSRTIMKRPSSGVVQKNADQSECNTIVMIFIGSVLFLALMDSVK
jgi:hypothetical protein